MLYINPEPNGDITVIVPVVAVQVGCIRLITGAAGVEFGAAVADPGRLVQPFMVCVTLNKPLVLTVIDEPIAPVLHNRAPVAVVDNVDVPSQLLTTVTLGVDGTDDGALINATVSVDTHPPAFLDVT
jgi:hypothetical protein